MRNFDAEGLVGRYLAKTAGQDYLFVGLWGNSGGMAAASPKMMITLVKCATSWRSFPLSWAAMNALALVR